MVLDTSVRSQVYVEDCEVCCHPIEVRYAVEEDAGLRLRGQGARVISRQRALPQQPPQPCLQCHVSGRSARPAEPRVKGVPGQAVLGAGLARFHNELMHPLRLVADVLAAAEAIDR